MIVHIETSFEAAHFLPGHPKCGNTHGHSYRVVVNIDGLMDLKTNMVVDFGKVKEVVRQFDHKCINDSLKYPTAERMVELFCNELVHLGHFHTVEVELWETASCSAKEKVLGMKG